MKKNRVFVDSNRPVTRQQNRVSRRIIDIALAWIIRSKYNTIGIGLQCPAGVSNMASWLLQSALILLKVAWSKMHRSLPASAVCERNCQQPLAISCG